jgi:fluoride exporter
VLRFLLVCSGGALGSGARFLVSAGMVRAFGDDFPHGTLAVNLIGSFLLGVIMTASLEADAISPDLRLFLGAGIMGGFTTYSSFNYELLALAGRGQVGLALLYGALTLVGCLLAGAAGMALVTVFT